MVDLTPTYLVPKVRTKVVTYTAIAASANNVAFEAPEYPTKTVQATGTFGGTVTIQGSNDPLALSSPASAVWFTCTDGSPGGSAADITYTAAGANIIGENPRFMRAISGVSVSDVDVIFNCSEA